MATSESDDFESADEELVHNVASKKKDVEDSRWPVMSSVVDSESDDDTECIPQVPRNNKPVCEKPRFRSFQRDMPTDEKLDTSENPLIKECNEEETKQEPVASVDTVAETKEAKSDTPKVPTTNQEGVSLSTEADLKKVTADKSEKRQTRVRRSADGSRKLGVKKLGVKVEKEPMVPADTTETKKEPFESMVSEESIKEAIGVAPGKPLSADVSEADMPEELKSDKKFKDIFKPQGWEKIGNEIELEEDLTEQKIQPVLDRLFLDDKESDNSTWGSWSSWGMSSFIETASAGVSTLTTHVSQGLSLLEETINIQNLEEQDTEDTEEKEVVTPDKEPKETVCNQSQTPFGFGSFLSGVSSITKLVETTGSKVMSGGLDTLEAIGKKTMEVLQEGDPGLKKKRAFFTNEGDKPNLSQILREAKEKAESEEKTIEEKQLARKIHFESLFDDYQGLVHLEALEMLSKQCNIKIQGHLINLSTDEMMSLQETLEEVKELCDLGSEDEGNEEEENKRDLKSRLADACQDLGITITYEKLEDIWKETKSYLAPPISHTNLEVFQCAISTIAKFTALCVERFHKTAELLLIKERRSTVSEADALVQLTHILTNEISLLATNFSNTLNEFIKVSDNANSISANITTVFLEATNASSYIQDAFRLLIPILQVGAL